MANHNDKRRQLDDEMSRFEAEISGPPGIGGVPPLQPPPPPPRTVIGSNTFTQIQQQLQQQHIDPPGTTGSPNSPHTGGIPGLPGPPVPPGPPGPPGPAGPPGLPGPPRPQGPPGTTNGSNGVPPLPPPPPPPGGFIGPDVPQRPGPSPGPGPGPGPCNIPQQQQQQQRPPPPPPPGFIPPQLARQQMPPNIMEDTSQMGPMMGGGPAGFMRPPGPPRHIGPPGPPRHPGMPGPPRHLSSSRHPGPPHGPPGFGGPQHGPPGPPPHGPHGPPGPDHQGPPGSMGPPNHGAPSMRPPGPPMPGPPTGPGPSPQNFGPSGPNHMPSNPPGPLLGGPGGLMPPGVGPMRGGHPPPPPPPPGVLQSQHQHHQGPNLPSTPFVPPIISKPPAIISSAPKLYSSQPVKHEVKPAELPPPVVGVSVPPPTAVPPDPGLEPKKKKMKPDIPSAPAQTAAFLTHAQEMAEKVRASTVTTVARPEGMNPPQGEEKKKEGKSRNKKNLRCAGGQIWEDSSLSEWDHDDFRIFCGDLGNDVTDELLTRYFNHFASFVKAKVVRDKRTNKSKGYGFISFSDPQDYIRAMKEMNGKYVGSRPIKLRKSTWKDRNVDMVQKKQREKQLLGLK